MYGGKIGSGDFGYGGADVNRFNGAEPVKYTLGSGRSVELYPLPKQDQADPTPTIPESTPEKEDPDEKSLSDLNKGNMPQLLSRTVLRFVSREKFNSSMTDKLDYLDELIKGDDQNSKLDGSGSFGERISNLKQEIQNDSKISRKEVYKKYRDLKQEIRQSQNQKCCDGALQELGLNKDNLPKELKKVYDKALSSKELVDAGKFKTKMQDAIKSYNKSVADKVEKGLMGYGTRRRSLSSADQNVLNEARNSTTPVNKDELENKLNAGFGGFAVDAVNENANAVDENVNAVNENANDGTGKKQDIDDDDNMNAFIDEVGHESDNGEFNVEENLLNGGTKEEGGVSDDPFMKEFGDGDDDEVNVDVGATDSKKTTGTNTAEEPFVDDFEEGFPNEHGDDIDTTKEIWEDNGIFNTDDDASAVRNEDTSAAQERKDFQENSWENAGGTYIEETTNPKNNDNEVKVKKQKGQKEEEFITKALEKFKNESQSELQKVLEDKLKGLKGKYSGIAFNIRAKTVIGRAYKLAKKFNQIDSLVAKGKLNDEKKGIFDKASNFKKEYAQKLLGGIKSGMTHSLEFRAGLEELSQHVGKETEKIETAAYKAIGDLMLKAGINRNVLNMTDGIKRDFVKIMANREGAEASNKNAGESGIGISPDEINKAMEDRYLNSQKIDITNEDLRSLLGGRLGYLLQKYGNTEEFGIRAQRMIDRAEEIDNAILNRNLGDDGKKRFLDLLNIKTGERYGSEFNVRLESLKTEMGLSTPEEDGDIFGTMGIDMGIENPLWAAFDEDNSISGTNDEDPFTKDFEEGF